MKKKKKEYKYKDWILDSQGEVDMCFWMQELKDNGYVKTFERGESRSLSNPLYNSFVHQLKTKTALKQETILQPHIYTWDFTIDWSQKGLDKFVNIYGHKWTKYFFITSSSMSFIENKPIFDFNSMTRLVTLNVKWLWERYGLFVQVVKNDDLFKETFVPQALLKTKTGKKRVFKYPIKSLSEYIKLQENGK